MLCLGIFTLNMNDRLILKIGLAASLHFNAHTHTGVRSHAHMQTQHTNTENVFTLVHVILCMKQSRPVWQINETNRV